MKRLAMLAALLGLVPPMALSQEVRPPSETGLPSTTSDPGREQVRAHTQAAGETHGGIQVPTTQRIYGAGLMTEVERSDYRARLGNATTAAERERIRASHHESMQARARERGVVLPEQPRVFPEPADTLDRAGVEAGTDDTP